MSKKILLTDDDREFVEAMKTRLEGDGYTVTVAYDGDECIDLARQVKPDIMITDVSMPKMDGYSMVKAIKQDNEIKHIPIIILSGKDQMEEIFKMEGINEFLVKPFEYDVLMQKVKSLTGA